VVLHTCFLPKLPPILYKIFDFTI